MGRAGRGWMEYGVMDVKTVIMENKDMGYEISPCFLLLSAKGTLMFWQS